MNKRPAFTALAILVPAPSAGILFGMILFPDSSLGTALFTGSKIWLLAMPVIWFKFIEKQKISLSPPKHGGFIAGLISGLAISAVILAAYLFLKESMIDPEVLTGKLNEIGLGVPWKYYGAAAYWILVNAVLEEYVWRWFVVKQCETLTKHHLTAAVCSAVLFTLHHILAMTMYFGVSTIALCTTGIFLGGVIWSAMYIKYRSIWPGYLSHAIVDLCIFGIGASILF